MSRLNRAVAWAVSASVCGAAAPSLAQDGYFWIEGDLHAANDHALFDFTLWADTNSSETLWFETFHHSGGTNAASETILGGSFDSTLELLDDTGARRGYDDDGKIVPPPPPYIRDALLSWPGVATNPHTPLNPATLTAGVYTLDLRPYDAFDTGHYMLDAVAPMGRMSLSGFDPDGGSADVYAVHVGSQYAPLSVFTDLAPTPGTTMDLGLARVVAGYTGAGGVWVDGATLRFGEFDVGRIGAGRVYVGNGGVLNTFDTEMATQTFSSSGSATVDGGTWQVAGQLIVGSQDDADLLITNGGLVDSSAPGLGSSHRDIISSDDTSTGNVDVTLGGTWVTDDLVVGYDGPGTLDINSGGVVETLGTADIGLGNATGTGRVALTGVNVVGARWDVSQNLNVGPTTFGSGELEIERGAEVRVQGDTTVYASGTVRVQGGSLTTGTFDNSRGGTLVHSDGTIRVQGGVFAPNSDTHYTLDGGRAGQSVNVELQGATMNKPGGTVIVGHEDDAQLHLEQGARVDARMCYIGEITGSHGLVTLHGTDAAGTPTTWASTRDVWVGNRGHAQLDVSGGARVAGQLGYVGTNGGSIGVATVAGTDVADNPSTWECSSEMSVGHRGDGTLLVLGGGVVTNTKGYIAHDPGSIGLVTVADPGSHWRNLDALRIGLHPGASATLNVEAGGRVTSATKDATIGPAGVVNVTGYDGPTPSSFEVERIDLRGDLSVLGGASVDVTQNVEVRSTGELFLGTGNLTADTVNNDGYLTLGVPDVSGRTTLDADLVNDAVFEIGATTRPLQVTGSVTLRSSSDLSMEIAGPAHADLYSSLSVGDNLHADGNLHVFLLHSYVPDVGEVFNLFDFNTYTGAFDVLDLPPLPTYRDWDASQLGATGDLAVISILPADYNGSGLVEQGDLNLALANWGAAYTALPNTWVNDRPTADIVDQAELNAVLNKWGSAAAPDLRGAPIPESATLLLLAIALSLATPRRGRSR